MKYRVCNGRRVVDSHGRVFTSGQEVDMDDPKVREQEHRVYVTDESGHVVAQIQPEDDEPQHE